MAVVQPQLALPNLGVGILDLNRPIAQRLDLGPLKLDPALDLLGDLVAVASLPVGCDVAGGDLLFACLSHLRRA